MVAKTWIQLNRLEQKINALGGITPPSDTLPPTAAFTSAPINITADAASYSFSIAFTDPDSTVNGNTIIGGAVAVTGPNGFSKTATLLSKTPSSGNASVITGTFNVVGPFSLSGNGAYEVRTLPSAISDVAGNAMGNTLIGTFTCAIAPTGSPSITLPSEITAGWSTFGITLFKDSGGQYFSDAVPDSYQTSSGAIAYSSPAALSTGTGTQADPRRLTELLANSAVGVIYLAPGDYNGVWTAPANRNLSVVCSTGKANINNFDLGVTWASQGSNVWLAQGLSGAIGMVQDFSVLDSYGNPKKLELRNSQAEVIANSFFLGTSGTQIYVRTYDNRAPDANIRLSKTGTNGQMTVSGTTFYAKNLVFNSGTEAFLLSGNSTGKAIFNACTFRFGQGNNLSTVNATTHYLFNCQAFHGRKDGFNYHISSGVAKTYEQNCEARYNGVWINELNAPKNNGSTIHDGGLIVRLNGVYKQNQNRQVHDVSPGTLSYNVGCGAGNPVSANTNDDSASFAFGLFDETATGAKAWYVGCTSSGGGKHDLQVHPGSTATLVDTSFVNILNQGTLIGATDTTAPVLTGVSISAAAPARIVLQYNETLSATSVPAISAFTIPTKTISAVTISGSTVLVDATTAFTAGQSGTVAYAVPGTNALKDAAGNSAIAFSAQAFNLPATDTTAPVLTGVSVNVANLARVILQYGEALDPANIPAISAYTVGSKTISAVTISGSTVLVDVTVAFTGGEVSTIAYAAPGTAAIRDAAGNVSASFGAQTFTVPGNSTDFRLLSSLPGSGWTPTAQVTPTFDGTRGVILTRVGTTVQDGRSSIVGPAWDQVRPLEIYYKGPTPSLRGSVGVSANPLDYLNRTNNNSGSTTKDHLAIGRSSIAWGADTVSGTTFTINTARDLRAVFTKSGSDIIATLSELVSGDYLTGTWNQLATATVAGAAPLLLNKFPFADSKETAVEVRLVKY